MWTKHIISLKKIIYDLDQGKVPYPETVSEKCTDMINYTLLLEALIQERNPEKVAGFKPRILHNDIMSNVKIK
jgi:hypothetical protein